MTVRADPASSVLDRIKRTLVGLRMPRALEMIDATVRQLERGEISPLETIEALLAEELSLVVAAIERIPQARAIALATGPIA
jgi:hypothetical protein